MEAEGMNLDLAMELERMRVTGTLPPPPEMGGTKEVEDSDQIQFNPPVYLQRYMTVQSIIQQLLQEPNCRDLENGKTVMEVGCAEFGMHVYMKKIQEIGKLIYLDIDDRLLQEKKHLLRPLPAEYLDKPCRPKPLVVDAYAGDITCVDKTILLESPRVWAVIAIELIEHLLPADVRGFEISVFGVINPDVVLVTTPNSDFNCVFNLPPGKFRHWDHKFEWSRAEFKAWCDRVCQEFQEYSYSLRGIGELAGRDDLGHVSQMAIFRKTPSSVLRQVPSSLVHDNSYKLVERIIFPNYIETRTMGQIVLDDIDYLINHCWLTKRNIEYSMENNIQEFIYPLKDVKLLLTATAKSNSGPVDEDFIKKVLMSARKDLIVQLDNGEYAIRIPVQHWDYSQRDDDDDVEDEMMDEDMGETCVANKSSESSNLDTDDADCWE